LKKWGEGASLIRKEWKARDEKDEDGNGERVKSHRDHKDDGMTVDDDEDDEEDDDDEEESEEEEDDEPDDLEATPRMLPRRTIGVHSPQSSLSSHPDADNMGANNNDLTDLTESLNSLSLVPNSIRFGRGGKSGGFIPRGPGRGRGRGRAGRSDRSSAGGRSDVMEVDVVPLGMGALPVRRGRGTRRATRIIV